MKNSRIVRYIYSIFLAVLKVLNAVKSKNKLYVGCLGPSITKTVKTHVFPSSAAIQLNSQLSCLKLRFSIFFNGKKRMETCTAMVNNIITFCPVKFFLWEEKHMVKH